MIDIVIPKSKLRTFISLFIFIFCLIKTDDFFISFLVYLNYLGWSLLPVFISAKMQKRGQQNDNPQN